MQTIQIPAGATSQSVFIELKNVADLLPATGYDYSWPMFVHYLRPDASPAQVNAAELTGMSQSWVSGGFIEVGVGVYRVDVPNAAIVPGANQAVVIVTDNTVLASSTVFGSVLIELTNIPTDFSGSALRRVAAR